MIAAHPDKCGGLKFLGLSLQAYFKVGFGLGVICAGAVANRVMHDELPFQDLQYVIGGFAVLMIALFSGPLLTFSSTLLEALELEF